MAGETAFETATEAAGADEVKKPSEGARDFRVLA